MIRRTLHPKTAPLIALLAAVVLVAGTGCGTLTGLPASLPTITDSGAVYAINGAPAGAPSALHLFTGTLLPADANFIFDIAFDINSDGNVVVLPNRAVASALAPTHTVALQTLNATFESVDRAPKNGYRADTAVVAHTNQLILVQSQDPNACGTSLTGTTIYAKIIVTAIDPVARKLTIRYSTDPNCGFFSFASGLPKD
jgi:hypothetical protein